MAIVITKWYPHKKHPGPSLRRQLRAHRTAATLFGSTQVPSSCRGGRLWGKFLGFFWWKRYSRKISELLNVCFLIYIYRWIYTRSLMGDLKRLGCLDSGAEWWRLAYYRDDIKIIGGFWGIDSHWRHGESFGIPNGMGLMITPKIKNGETYDHFLKTEIGKKTIFRKTPILM